MHELRGVIERENAACGILLTLEKPTGPMIKEAKMAGQFNTDYSRPIDRLQIATVEEILAGA